MHHIIPAEPALDREQRQNRQRDRSNPRVADRHPRQDSQHCVGDQSYRKAIHDKSWCTGEDSNLRTSLGGTDLQSVGFNHSPTCAKTFGRCGRRASSGRLHYASAGIGTPTRKLTQHKLQFTLAKQGNQGRAQDNCEDHCTPGIKLRKECVGKTCRAAYRRSACRKNR
jgi:hypothetical protein